MDVPAGQYMGKPCKRAHSGLRYLSSKDCVACAIERARRRYEKNPKALCEYQRLYYEANAEARREYSRRWREANAEALCEYRRRHYEKNAEAARERTRQWREANREAARERNRQWSKTNPHKVNAIGAKRRAAKLQATPGWLTKQHLAEIEGVYAEAQARSQETGDIYHVDHIVPLQGRNVCGLHVPWNLRAIPAVENLKKKNKEDWCDQPRAVA